MASGVQRVNFVESKAHQQDPTQDCRERMKQIWASIDSEQLLTSYAETIKVGKEWSQKFMIICPESYYGDERPLAKELASLNNHFSTWNMSKVEIAEFLGKAITKEITFNTNVLDKNEIRYLLFLGGAMDSFVESSKKKAAELQPCKKEEKDKDTCHLFSHCIIS